MNVRTNVVVDGDLDPACHFDEDPDPTFHFIADPDHARHFDEDPDPTFHFDPDPDSSFQIKVQNLEKVLKQAHIPYWNCVKTRVSDPH
jgi:hypothetical protein